MTKRLEKRWTALKKPYKGKNMFTKKEIWQIAREQSARDLNCAPEDFLKSEPVLASGGLGDGAKKYYKANVRTASTSKNVKTIHISSKSNKKKK